MLLLVFLRIEDTDQKREVENGVESIIKSLKEFDVEPDEGMISDTEFKGDYGSKQLLLLVNFF